MFGYFIPIAVVVMALMAATVATAQNFILDNETMYSIVILVGMYVTTLLAGLFGVWLQKRTITKIEEAEENAYII